MNTNDDFELMFAETYPKFLKNLVKKYSNLSSREVQLCMLIKMGYPSKKILEILNISSSTHANLRSRIRKKMGLTRDQYLTNNILCI